GVSCAGSTLKETRRTGSPLEASRFWSPPMRAVKAGQKSGQGVNTKSATHTWPARSPAVSAVPLRSVSVKAGSVERTGRGGEGRRRHTTSPSATTRPAATSAARAPRRRSLVGFDGRGRLSVGEGTGDRPQVGQQREHQEDAQDRGSERDIGERPLLEREVHVEERDERRL